MEEEMYGEFNLSTFHSHAKWDHDTFSNSLIIHIVHKVQSHLLYVDTLGTSLGTSYERLKCENITLSHVKINIDYHMLRYQ